MSDHDRFIGLCLRGDVLMEEINDFVSEWHDTDTDESVSEYLGLSPEEYDLWVEQPRALRMIVAAREDELPLTAALERYAELEPVAARGVDPDAAKVVLDWLRTTGRISG